MNSNRRKFTTPDRDSEVKCLRIKLNKSYDFNSPGQLTVAKNLSCGDAEKFRIDSWSRPPSRSVSINADGANNNPLPALSIDRWIVLVNKLSIGTPSFNQPWLAYENGLCS